MKTTGLIKNIFLIPMLVLILGLILVNCGDDGWDEGIGFKLYETTNISNVNYSFGASVALSGDWAVVGSTTGSVANIKFYSNNGMTWTNKDGFSPGNGFLARLAVDIDGDYAVMGSKIISLGAVFLYKKVSGSWSSNNSVSGSSTEFGAAVAISSNRVVVGESSSYTVYFYDTSGDIFDSKGSIYNETNVDAKFGYSVDMDGAYAVVGAYSSSNNGSAYICYNDDSTWEQITELSNPNNYFNYGESVAICGDNAIVSANDGARRATIFHNNSGQWVKVRDIDWSEGSAAVSVSVAIAANYAVVGQVAGADGRIRVYKNNNGAWNQVGDEQYIGNSFGDDMMGLALDDYNLIVGSPNGASGGQVWFYE